MGGWRREMGRGEAPLVRLSRLSHAIREEDGSTLFYQRAHCTAALVQLIPPLPPVRPVLLPVQVQFKRGRDSM